MKKDIFLIAEVGQAHDGSLGLLHSYIDAFANTGIDAIKFQTHIAEAESSKHEPFRVNFSSVDETRFDYWKRMSLSVDQWQEIKTHCEEVGLEFMSSPFSIAAVELLESIGLSRYKVGSGEVNNLLLLDRIKETQKPVILSSGMSSWDELDLAISYLNPGVTDLSILQCTTQYPTPSNNWGLNVIHELKKKYPGISVGYSDHSGTIYAGLAAVSLGAEILEFHIVFDKNMFGPDSSSSLNLHEVRNLVTGIRTINDALRNPIDKDNIESYKDLKTMFGKSLALSRSRDAGHRLEISDLESKKPAGKGIAARDFKEVIGKKLKRSMKRYEFLKKGDFE